MSYTLNSLNEKRIFQKSKKTSPKQSKSSVNAELMDGWDKYEKELALLL